MGWRRGVPALWLGVPRLLLGVLFVAMVSSSAYALSTDVHVTVPEGIIAVEGKASPNAHIQIYENGNMEPSASVMADSAGNFSQELPQNAAGVVNVSIQATDTAGVETPLVTKQVAVISHQTSTLTIILPPSSVVAPDSVPFEEGSLNFTGRTVPDGLVKITIEPSTILTTTANSQGDFAIPLLARSLQSAGVYTYGIQVTSGSEVSDYIQAGTFTVTPPVAAPVFRQPMSFVRSFLKTSNNFGLSVTFPSGSEYTATGPFVITGHAESGAEINFYDDEKPIGTIAASSDDTWQFYFSPYKTTHHLSLEACEAGRCSELRTLTVHSERRGVQACRPALALDSYRLTGTVGNQLKLAGNLTEGEGGVAVVSWGDGSEERLDTSSSSQFTASHTYQKAGVYSGFVVMSSGKSCQTAIYFAVEITGPLQSLPTLLLPAIIIVGLLAIGWSLFRIMPRLRA